VPMTAAQTKHTPASSAAPSPAATASSAVPHASTPSGTSNDSDYEERLARIAEDQWEQRTVADLMVMMQRQLYGAARPKESSEGGIHQLQKESLRLLAGHKELAKERDELAARSSASEETSRLAQEQVALLRAQLEETARLMPEIASEMARKEEQLRAMDAEFSSLGSEQAVLRHKVASMELAELDGGRVREDAAARIALLERELRETQEDASKRAAAANKLIQSSEGDKLRVERTAVDRGRLLADRNQQAHENVMLREQLQAAKMANLDVRNQLEEAHRATNAGAGQQASSAVLEARLRDMTAVLGRANVEKREAVAQRQEMRQALQAAQRELARAQGATQSTDDYGRALEQVLGAVAGRRESLEEAVHSSKPPPSVAALAAESKLHCERVLEYARLPEEVRTVPISKRTYL